MMAKMPPDAAPEISRVRNLDTSSPPGPGDGRVRPPERGSVTRPSVPTTGGGAAVFPPLFWTRPGPGPGGPWTKGGDDGRRQPDPRERGRPLRRAARHVR